ncbi:hypothetical protein RFI_35291 [Reticulomyxa filosa]|uniref:Uncharacterized protein n=1 Tax=Reticulomyxa filosa TaxID=46433 RepID=X6LN43_RETFI|nr:hypothetical protein RFI_35291 [Reticulomyxa filosa]|eukprot:ETO02145.1 hypothetical protein RFI_35291 [Reticulomyxa filosa]
MLKTKKHIPLICGKSLTGTARFASINTHLGYEQSRRDDLETIGYVLFSHHLFIYFFLFLYYTFFFFDWVRSDHLFKNKKGKTKDTKYRRIRMLKEITGIEDLCAGLPEEFITYMKYCRNLRFEEKPKYAYLRNLFRAVFKKNKLKNDGRYDWTEKFFKKNANFSPDTIQLPRQFETKTEKADAPTEKNSHSSRDNGGYDSSLYPINDYPKKHKKHQKKALDSEPDHTAPNDNLLWKNDKLIKNKIIKGKKSIKLLFFADKSAQTGVYTFVLKRYALRSFELVAIFVNSRTAATLSLCLIFRLLLTFFL